MVDTGIDVLSIDNIVDLEAAKRLVGCRVCLAGNVDPVKIMLDGTADDVEAGVKSCLEQAWDNPRGYVLATGCGIPNAAPAENVFRFMENALCKANLASICTTRLM